MTESFRIKKSWIGYGSILLIFLTFLILFGTSGLFVVAGFSAFIIYPFYLLLGLYVEDALDRVIYSFFLSIIMVPLALWYIDRLIGSLWISLILTSALFYSAYFYFRRKK